MADDDKAVAASSAPVGVAPPRYAELEIRSDGKLVFENVIVGRYEHSVNAGLLTLNLGWCREAGLHVKLLADPEVDRKRSGVVLDR